MTDLSNAKSIALRVAQRGCAFAIEVDDGRTIEEPFGWVFFYRKAESPHELIGSAPIIVDRETGKPSVAGTNYPIAWFIHAYRELGQERFDAREWREFIQREYLDRESEEESELQQEREAVFDEGKLRGDPSAIKALLARRKAALELNSRWPQRANGTVDTGAAMSTLARLFPSLREASGIDPFDRDTFTRWLCSGIGRAAARAGCFLLYVSNPEVDPREVGRKLGLENAEGCLQPFDLTDALGAWDAEHTRAFIAWVEAPFWPRPG
jgi:hypothetical protein